LLKTGIILRYVFLIIILAVSFIAVSCNNTAIPGKSEINGADFKDFTVETVAVSPSVAEINQSITVSLNVMNPNDTAGTGSVSLLVNKIEIESKSIELDAGAAGELSFIFSEAETGEYRIDAGNLSSVIYVVKQGGSMIDLIFPVNIELAVELSRLPDLKEIDNRDNEALVDIFLLASNEDSSLLIEEILDEGIKGKRSYCASLEALLWLAYDYDYEQLYSNFQHYNMHSFLLDSWRNSSTSDNYRSDRWKSIDDVVNRLNSPRLVSVYMRDNIEYDTDLFSAMTSSHLSKIFDVTTIFNSKKGVCRQMAVFAQHCLINSGYSYEGMTTGNYGVCFMGVHSTEEEYGHAVCTVKEDGSYYSINNGVFTGPFSNIETAANSAALFVGLSEWSVYITSDLDIITDHLIDDDIEPVILDDSAKKEFIKDKILDEWPSNAVSIDDPRNDYLAKIEDNVALDIESVKAFMNNNNLYISIEMARKLPKTHKASYFVYLDYDGDKEYDYKFGTNSTRRGLLIDRSINKYNKETFDAWWTINTTYQDTVEMQIPVDRYNIPCDVSIYCGAGYITMDMDTTEWLKIP
jgi:hypothetical protein